MAVENVAVVKHQHYISEMSQNYVCFIVEVSQNVGNRALQLKREEEGGLALRLMLIDVF
jgi:hypothetical protein